MNTLISPKVVPIDNPRIKLQIAILTKFTNIDLVNPEEIAKEFSASELELIWQQAHMQNNFKLRNKVMIAEVSVLGKEDPKRKELFLYLIEWNRNDKSFASPIFKQFMTDFSAETQLINQMKDRYINLL